ncbi:MAG: TetR/AcrR family transcriptional regulator [Chloroflexi bacterium]|nr:TetR/AcrR family transcriptional regulator [Chloroflexota bacterium]
MKSAGAGDTRVRLIEAATKLLWERSYHSTSVDDLCAVAGARKGSLYHFFPSKVDLAVAAIRWSWEEARRDVFEPVFRSKVSGLSQLQRLASRTAALQKAALEAGGHVLGCPFGSLGQEMAHQDERVREAVQEVFDGHCAYIEAALRRAADAGEIEDGDMRQRARAIFALLEGAFLLAKVANDPRVLKELASAIPVLAKRSR